MRVLSYNPGHDGAATLIEKHELQFCLEGAKDRDSGTLHCLLHCSFVPFRLKNHTGASPVYAAR